MIGNEFDDNEGQYYRCLSHDKQRQIMIMMIMMLGRVLYGGDDHMRFYHHTHTQHHVMMIILWRSASYDVQHRKIIMII